jgi:hypothetical protein
MTTPGLRVFVIEHGRRQLPIQPRGVFLPLRQARLPVHVPAGSGCSTEVRADDRDPRTADIRPRGSALHLTGSRGTLP